MMTKARVGEARFSILLHGDNLPVDKIESTLGLQATRMIHKGDILNRLPLIEAPTDEWVHSISMTEPDGADADLNALLTQLGGRMDALRALEHDFQVTLRMYIQSDYAQIAYCLMPETLKRLVALGLPLSVSSLSWGEVGI